MRLYIWEQVTHLFAVIPPTTRPGIKHFRKQLHQMVDVLEFSARVGLSMIRATMGGRVLI
jgi:hypothetical protein